VPASYAAAVCPGPALECPVLDANGQGTDGLTFPAAGPPPFAEKRKGGSENLGCEAVEVAYRRTLPAPAQKERPDKYHEVDRGEEEEGTEQAMISAVLN
jgi:hypothetical protein